MSTITPHHIKGPEPRKKRHVGRFQTAWINCKWNCPQYMVYSLIMEELGVNAVLSSLHHFI